MSAGALRAGQLRAEGRSLGEIAHALNCERVPTPSGGGTWTRSSVQHALIRLRGDEAGRSGEPRARPRGTEDPAAPAVIVKIPLMAS
ncbi:hypothetical protein GCM10010124_11160 [Pilimelia terevasa]|uniref:Recombinase domain-containing protein n=1 Tax=Pilimelia terevasa TaxID=53372 RepID=A0A8J3FFH1_9ACTN|nr:hypothetical protein GCM10010124_11160 [Pilimelia terevasa]